MPNRLNKEELEDKIKGLDETFSLDASYNFALYKNNRSIIKLKHTCGKTLNTTWKNFQEGKTKCSCEIINNRKIKYDQREKIGRGKYLVKKDYLNKIFNDKDYLLLDNPVYSGNNKMKVKIKHIVCGNFYFTTPNRFQQGQKCPYCANMIRVGALPGAGATKIAKYLQEKNIFSANEKYFSECKDKREMPFDFEDSFKNIIEFDGEQHFNPNKRGYKTAVLHDKMKNKFCEKNSIHLLRIPFDEEENINTILDLFYSNNFEKLMSFKIFYLSPDLKINNDLYYSRWCRSKTV